MSAWVVGPLTCTSISTSGVIAGATSVDTPLVHVNNSSYTITLTAVGATSSYNFAFPAGHGGSGDVLTSSNGGVMTWTPSVGSGNNVLATSPTLVTPVLGNATATTVVVNNGTNAVTLTAVGATSNWNFAFPAGHGGTGDVLTSSNGSVMTWTPSTGSGNNVLATSPTLVTPVLGNATATTVVVNNGTNAVTLTAVGATSNWNFAFPAGHGATNSVLTSTNGGVMNWTATTGTGNNVFDTNPTFSADITVGGYYHGTGGVIGLGGFSSDGSNYNFFKSGTWTPTIWAYNGSNMSSAPTPVTYGYQLGHWSLVGKILSISWQVNYQYGTGGALFAQALSSDTGLLPGTTLSTVMQTYQAGTCTGTLTNIGGVTNPIFALVQGVNAYGSSNSLYFLQLLSGSSPFNFNGLGTGGTPQLLAGSITIVIE
jgi:hypothetical protein